MPKTQLPAFLLFALGLNAQGLTLMTYNARLDLAVDGENDWAHRKDFFTSQIRFYGPDIFGVQEALPGQAADIAAALSRYGHVGIGRDGAGKGEASGIYYKKDGFAVKETATFSAIP